MPQAKKQKGKQLSLYKNATNVTNPGTPKYIWRTLETKRNEMYGHAMWDLPGLQKGQIGSSIYLKIQLWK